MIILAGKKRTVRVVLPIVPVSLRRCHLRQVNPDAGAVAG